MIKVIKDKNYIVFKGVRPTFDYDINIGAIKSEGIDKWVEHLREKNWFNPELEVDFIKIFNQAQEDGLV